MTRNDKGSQKFLSAKLDLMVGKLVRRGRCSENRGGSSPTSYTSFCRILSNLGREMTCCSCLNNGFIYPACGRKDMFLPPSRPSLIKWKRKREFHRWELQTIQQQKPFPEWSDRRRRGHNTSWKFYQQSSLMYWYCVLGVIICILFREQQLIWERYLAHVSGQQRTISSPATMKKPAWPNIPSKKRVNFESSSFCRESSLHGVKYIGQPGYQRCPTLNFAQKDFQGF